jgi:hypothetical protein
VGNALTEDCAYVSIVPKRDCINFTDSNLKGTRQLKIKLRTDEVLNLST